MEEKLKHKILSRSYVKKIILRISSLLSVWKLQRQAFNRLETGETQPNTDTLKLLSKVFDVSINTLLCFPQQPFCQCCAMPLNEDGLISHKIDGSYNEDYCKWWYFAGGFTYQSKKDFLYYMLKNMPNRHNTD